MQHFTKLTQFGALFVGLISSYGCDEPHIRSAKEVCACFDVAGYKLQKGHKEGAQGFGRCKEQMNKALAQFETQANLRAAFLAELEKCPAATTTASPAKPASKAVQ